MVSIGRFAGACAVGAAVLCAAERQGSAQGWMPGPAAPAALTPRASHAAAYDGARDRTVLFGGYDSWWLNDTWEFDGTAWTPGPPPPAALEIRGYTAMAYDSARQVVVLFGGYEDGCCGGGVWMDDTWEYDGTSWTLGPAAPPALVPRAAHAMAYDRGRARSVMFGGWDDQGNILGDTWEYDGTSWSQGPSGMGPQWQHAMAYDESRSRTVLFGYGAWEYDGTSWIAGAAAPPALGNRSGHAMAYDAARARVVLHGGSGPAGLSDDTWFYDGNAWTPGPAAPAGLSARERHALAFHASLLRVVMFGGAAGLGNHLDDTWELTCLSLSPGFLPQAVEGTAYAQQITAAGGTSPYVYSVMSGSVPPGLSLSPGGLLAGTPTATGIYAFTVRADDATGCAGTSRYTLVVGCAASPITISPSFLVPGRTGQAYTLQLGASGGTPPYFFSPLGSLPPGLSLSGSGLLSGTPTRTGTFPFGVLVTDVAGCSGSRTYVLGVTCGVIALAPAALPSGRIGFSYRATITASGGTAPYTFAKASGALPPGISFYDIGWLSGTPTTNGSYFFTAEATDRNACTGSRAYVIVVGCPSIQLVPPTLPDGTVGVAYQQSLDASGGIGPYSFDVTGGSLPPGLALSSNGFLWGTPTTNGCHTFRVRAIDAGSCPGSHDYVLRIGPTADVLAGEGPAYGNGSGVTVFTPAGNAAPVSFQAYGAGRWGVNVAAAELDGGTFAEIVTGPGPSGVFGPHLRGFQRTGAPIAKVSFYAYATLRYGAHVSAGLVDPDVYEEIVAGAGPGALFGPHVRGFDVDAASASAIAKVNYFAYATLRYGVHVAAGDVEGDGLDEMLTAPGPGPTFAAQVRGWNYDGLALASIPRINFEAFPTRGYGGTAAAGDADADGREEIAAAPGPGPGSAFPSRIRGFDFDGAAVTPLPGFDATPFSTHFGGKLVLEDLCGSPAADVVAGAGEDPAADSTVNALTYGAGALTPMGPPFVAFPSSSHGVNVGAGSLGY